MSNSVEEDGEKAELKETPPSEIEAQIVKKDEGLSERDEIKTTDAAEMDKTANGLQIEMSTPSDAETLVASPAFEPSTKTEDLPVTSTPKTPTSASSATGNAAPATASEVAAVTAAAKEMKKKKNKKGSSAGEGLPDNAGRIGSGIEIIRIKERHGQFRKAVPIMPLPLAIVLCLVNVVLPGIGTLFSALTVFCCGKTEFENKGKAFSVNVIAAILQIVTIPILVGWIWSIIWGVTFITSALGKDEDKDEENPTPQQV